jgi:hypothetical protein
MTAGVLEVANNKRPKVLGLPWGMAGRAGLDL